MLLDAHRTLEPNPERLPSSSEGVYRFGLAEVDPHRRLLLVDGRPVALTARAFDLLLFLIRHRHRSLRRSELLEHLWPDARVEDGNLSVNISQLRKALANPDSIVTLPRYGYRFAAQVTSEPAFVQAGPIEPRSRRNPV